MTVKWPEVHAQNNVHSNAAMALSKHKNLQSAYALHAAHSEPQKRNKFENAMEIMDEANAFATSCSMYGFVDEAMP